MLKLAKDNIEQDVGGNGDNYLMEGNQDKENVEEAILNV